MDQREMSRDLSAQYEVVEVVYKLARNESSHAGNHAKQAKLLAQVQFSWPADNMLAWVERANADWYWIRVSRDGQKVPSSS